MNTLTVVAFACLAVIASAAPSGWGHHDDGQWHGEGLLESQWHGEGLHGGVGLVGGILPAAHAVVAGPVHGAGAVLIPPKAGAVVAGPAWGHVGAGWGHGGWAHGGHAAGAVIAGPAGTVVASGHPGVAHWGHHGHW